MSEQEYSGTALAASLPQISDDVTRDAGQFREQFIHASPFKHVMIENFFEPQFAEQLLAEFPSFDPKLAINEMGEVGGKAVNTKIREISPAYRELYQIIGSQPFLELMSRISGIPDLLMDPKLYGGGTHDNRHGQELDVHVDFNFDEVEQTHRRLNLIVYMNKEWETGWGGDLEIHSNPWDPDHDEVRAFAPTFNRCVMFETNEISWHGFPKINLPEDKRHLSRKSISIYLYTKARPAEEVVPLHGTFYVQRPLPSHLQAGRTLTGEDVQDLKTLLQRRDDWIRYYHKMELSKSGEIARLNQALLGQEVHAPLTGYALQVGTARGVFADRWVSSHAELTVKPVSPITQILVRGWRPDQASSAKIRVSCEEKSVEVGLDGGSFEVKLPLAKAADQPFTVKIDTDSSGPTVEPGVDNRDLVFVLTEIRAIHSLANGLKELLG